MLRNPHSEEQHGHRSEKHKELCPELKELGLSKQKKPQNPEFVVSTKKTKERHKGFNVKEVCLPCFSTTLN